MTIDEAKELFRKDKDAYGKPKALMSKVEQVYIAAYNRALADVEGCIENISDDMRVGSIRTANLESLKLS